ncbi:MAG TPA: hypothetical protein VM782_00985 [Stellaceae bacterium]|nr:hypothetical protein [Stellaceae bacterium]
MSVLKRALRTIFLPREAVLDPYAGIDPMYRKFDLTGMPRREGDPRRLKLELELLRYLP